MDLQHTSPSKSPVKKRRGRRPANAAKSPKKAAKTAAKVASVKAKVPSKPKSKKAKSEQQPEKGNTVIDSVLIDTTPMEIFDSDSEIEETSRRNWADEEKTQFFNFLLAPDEAGDRRFEQYKKNPGHVYKRVGSE
ncbi:hypothetical protein DFH09DRAFT_1095571 [Mycena vulgaris]|nr:hypothetical protein DFH09DRAFT_1095571 [Mycena vulgaris]